MDFENAEDVFGYYEVFTELEDIESIESIESSTEGVSVTFDATEELLSNI